MTTVHSTIEPETIQIDTIEHGIARLLVHWNIRQVEIPDLMIDGETRNEWQYSERVLLWTLPKKYTSLAEVREYLTSIQSEILDWAEATEMSGTTLEE